MSDTDEWVMLSYRLPREPSTPRIAVWRKLKRLGVAVVGDGLVALPLDARTREHLEWIADEIRAAKGGAIVWLAHPTSRADQQSLVDDLRAARAAEYDALLAEAVDPSTVLNRRTVERLRRELRRINRRDYFPPAERDTAKAAVDTLRRRLASQQARV